SQGTRPARSVSHSGRARLRHRARFGAARGAGVRDGRVVSRRAVRLAGGSRGAGGFGGRAPGVPGHGCETTAFVTGSRTPIVPASVSARGRSRPHTPPP